MTQEEKAMAYDKAIEKIKYVMVHGVSPVLNKEDIEDIFPELKESEDERIRKAIIDFFKSVADNTTYSLVPKKDILAWLEKHKPVEHLELKAGRWYICHRAFCCRADHLTVQEGERFMCEKDDVVKGFVIKDAEKYFKECNAPAPEAKWSEEDESKVEDIVYFLNTAKTHYASTEAIDDCVEWLKSLKQRLEGQQ